VKYPFIYQHRRRYSVRRMCRVLSVSPSGYYDWVDRPLSARSQRHRRLTAQIQLLHQASRETYGAPRIHRDLVETGEVIGKNTVAMLMRRGGIVPKTVRKFRVTTDSRKTHPAPNILQRGFSVPAPNRCWVSDMTFIPTREGWLYLTVILDLFSRVVVGWSMDRRMTSTMNIDALRMALSRRGGQAPALLHSDQGSQYAAADYQAMLKTHNIRCSMSRKGNCWDNAVAESFFHTLKTELVHHEDYRTRDAARASIFEYIEVFYNRQRRHSHLDQQAPLTYEMMTTSH
jgi:putative transposase